MLSRPLPLLTLNQTTENPVKKDKNSGFLVSFDIPLINSRRTVNVERIENASLGVSSVLSPWSDNINYSSAFTPELGFANRYLNLKVGGGIEKGLDQGNIRASRYIDGSMDLSIWKFVVVGDGFYENENDPGIVKGLAFNADFSRTSSGYRGWGGLKFGNFARNFVSVKGGPGYVKTEAYKIYDIDLPERLWLYEEEFKIKSLSIEGKITNYRFSEGLKVEGNYYKRVENSPDPYRFGRNEFGDVLLQGTFEVIPSLKYDFIRLMIRGSKRLGTQIGHSGLVFDNNPDSLLFRNDQATIRVYLRIAFN